MTASDEAGSEKLERQLEWATYDCVVIGGGLRLRPAVWRYSGWS